MNTTPRDLDTLVEAARITASSNPDSQASAVLRLLSEFGGHATLSELLDSGAPREVVASLVDDQLAGDRRRKQRARLGIVGGVPVVWLTSTGWQAVGRSSGREVVPTADTIGHALAPRLLDEWLSARTAHLGSEHISVRVLTGAACRRWSEEVKARAWALISSHAGAIDSDGAVGTLTGGYIPDALVIERWMGPHAEEWHTSAWPGSKPSPDDLAETAVAVEVEDTRKSGEALRSKVERADALINRLHLCRSVLWLVRSRDVRDRLADLGVGTENRRPGQLLVAASALGLPGENLSPVGTPWWPLRLVPTLDGPNTN